MQNVAEHAVTTVLIIIIIIIIIIRLTFTLRDETFERAVVGQRLIIAGGGERCPYCVAAFNFIGYLAVCNDLKTVTCIPAPKHTSLTDVPSL
jgi:hypothetical protein